MRTECFSNFLVAAISAAAPPELEVALMYESASVAATVTSHDRGFRFAMVVKSDHLDVCHHSTYYYYPHLSCLNGDMSDVADRFATYLCKV